MSLVATEWATGGGWYTETTPARTLDLWFSVVLIESQRTSLCKEWSIVPLEKWINWINTSKFLAWVLQLHENRSSLSQVNEKLQQSCYILIEVDLQFYCHLNIPSFFGILSSDHWQNVAAFSLRLLNLLVVQAVLKWGWFILFYLCKHLSASRHQSIPKHHIF